MSIENPEQSSLEQESNSDALYEKYPDEEKLLEAIKNLSDDGLPYEVVNFKNRYKLLKEEHDRRQEIKRKSKK